MGNCCRIKTVPYKYSEHEDGSTHRNDGIVVHSDDNITGLSSNSQNWLLAQDFLLSIYSDFSLRRSFNAQERIHSLLLSNELIFYAGKTVHLLSHLAEDRGKLEGHSRNITTLDTHENLLVSGSIDWTLRLWDLTKTQELSKFEINWNVVTCVKFSHPLIVQTSEDLRLRIWDIRDNKLSVQTTATVGDNFANCCDVEENNIITGHRGFDGNGCECKLWDMRKMNSSVVDMKGHSEAVQGVKFLSGSVISCGKDGKLISYNMMGEQKFVWEHTGKVPFVAMDEFKKGIIVANIEPKVMYFSINPFAHEA